MNILPEMIALFRRCEFEESCATGSSYEPSATRFDDEGFTNQIKSGCVTLILFPPLHHDGSEIIFHEDHILAVHDIHRQQLVAGMNEEDLKELTHWLAEYQRSKQE